MGGAAAPRTSVRPTTVPGQLRSGSLLAMHARPMTSGSSGEAFVPLSNVSPSVLPNVSSGMSGRTTTSGTPGRPTTIGQFYPPALHPSPRRAASAQGSPRKTPRSAGRSQQVDEPLPLPPSCLADDSTRSSSPREAQPRSRGATTDAERPPIQTPSGSARFRLQQELASRNVDAADDGHRQVARETLAMHLRLSDSSASKSLALAHIQHPLHTGPWAGRESEEGWRPLPPPIKSDAPPSPRRAAVPPAPPSSAGGAAAGRAFNLMGFAEQQARPSTAPVHHFEIEQIYERKLFPARQGDPRDEVTLATIDQMAGESHSARGRRRIPVNAASHGSSSARGAAEDVPHAPPEEWLTDEQALAAFQRAEALPPLKRVEERMRLLHKYETLQEWIKARAVSHTRERLAAQAVDYMQKNADPSNFTQAAIARKQERLKAANRTRAKRSVYALSVARNPERKNDSGGFSSELLTRVRQFRRICDLKKGFAAFHGTIDAKRAQRWMQLVGLAHATLHLYNIGKLAKVVKHIRTSSRVITAVRTLQRKFREQRESRLRKNFIFNLVSIQRRVKYWLGLVKRRRLRQAASVVISFLQGTARLSPMARTMHRYARRVRIMQRFARGYFAIQHGKLNLLTRQWNKFETAKLVELHEGRTKKALAAATAAGVAAAPAASGPKLVVDKQGRVVKGQFAGVPEELLDVPLLHVPEEARRHVLRKLVSELRDLFITESITWDQKVLLASEEHPAFKGASRGMNQLAVVQHERQNERDKLASGVTEKAPAILNVLGEATAGSGGGGSGGSETASHAPASTVPPMKSLLKNKLNRVTSSLADQRAALEEIRRSIPRPFRRHLAPAEMMQDAFNDCYQHCKEHKILEMRTIRGAPLIVVRKTKSSTSGHSSSKVLPDQS